MTPVSAAAIPARAVTDALRSASAATPATRTLPRAMAIAAVLVASSQGFLGPSGNTQMARAVTIAGASSTAKAISAACRRAHTASQVGFSATPTAIAQKATIGYV